MKIKFKNLKNSNEGVAGVVIALLMIGLVISAISFVQVVYVPMWMGQKEAEHMDEVAKQFSQLKFAVDTLSAGSVKNTAITAPITLGSKEMPFFSSSRSYGTINVVSEDFKITFTTDAGDTETYTIGALKYASENSYFIDQSYTYENGAVILAQEKGESDYYNIVLLQPNIFVQGNKLTFNLIKLNDIDGEKTISGFGTYPVKTYFVERLRPDEMSSVRSITIYNSHLQAWKEFFNDLFKDTAMSASYTQDNNAKKLLIITFSDLNGAILPDVTINQDKINVKITPGYSN